MGTCYDARRMCSNGTPGCSSPSANISLNVAPEKASISHSKDLLASISHSSHASSKSHSHTVPRSPTHTISVHTVLVCTSTYSVLYVLLRIPYWMYLYVLNSTCTRTSSTYRSTYSTQVSSVFAVFAVFALVFAVFAVFAVSLQCHCSVRARTIQTPTAGLDVVAG